MHFAACRYASKTASCAKARCRVVQLVARSDMYERQQQVHTQLLVAQRFLKAFRTRPHRRPLYLFVYIFEWWGDTHRLASIASETFSIRWLRPDAFRRLPLRIQNSFWRESEMSCSGKFGNTLSIFKARLQKLPKLRQRDPRSTRTASAWLRPSRSRSTCRARPLCSPNLQ